MRFRSDLFVYLSGPITARGDYTVEDNVAQAVKVYFGLLREGISCFCPHLSAAFPSAWAADMPYEMWMAYDFAVIDRCTHVMLLPRWETSSGALREADYARATGKPLVNWDHSFEQELAS